MSIMNRKFQTLLFFNNKIYITSSFVTIRDIKTNQHVFFDYVIIDMWILKQEFNDSIMIKIIREIHFVNDLRVNMLININIQIVEKIIIDISQRKFILFNCSKFFIFINVFNVDKRVKRIIKNKQIVLLSSMLITNVLI